MQRRQWMSLGLNTLQQKPPWTSPWASSSLLLVLSGHIPAWACITQIQHHLIHLAMRRQTFTFLILYNFQKISFPDVALGQFFWPRVGVCDYITHTNLASFFHQLNAKTALKSLGLNTLHQTASWTSMEHMLCLALSSYNHMTDFHNT